MPAQTTSPFIKNRSFTVFSLLCGIILTLVADAVIYWNQQHKVTHEIESMLEEAISIDIANRASQYKDRLRFGQHEGTPTGLSNVNAIGFPETKDLPVNVKFQKLFQSYLLQRNLIDIHAIDSLFWLALEKAPINEVKMAIRFTNNITEKTADSAPNSPLYASNYALKEIPMGILREGLVQTFVKIPQLYIIQRAKFPLLIALSVIWILILFLFIFIHWRKKERPVPATGFYALCKRHRFDMDNAILYDRGRPVSMSPQSARLLKLFIEAPNYYLDHAYMESTLWGSSQLQSNRREQAIARLRKSLEKKSTLYIVNARGTGYQLMVGHWWSAQRLEQCLNLISTPFIKH